MIPKTGKSALNKRMSLFMSTFFELTEVHLLKLNLTKFVITLLLTFKSAATLPVSSFPENIISKWISDPNIFTPANFETFVIYFPDLNYFYLGVAFSGYYYYKSSS